MDTLSGTWKFYSVTYNFLLFFFDHVIFLLQKQFAAKLKFWSQIIQVFAPVAFNLEISLGEPFLLFLFPSSATPFHFI